MWVSLKTTRFLIFLVACEAVAF